MQILRCLFRPRGGREDPEIVDLPQPDDFEGQKRLEVFRKQAQLLIKGNQDAGADLPYLVDCYVMRRE